MPPPLDVVRSKLLPAGVTGYVEPRRGEALAEERSLPEVRRRLPAVNRASQADEVHLRGEGVGPRCGVSSWHSSQVLDAA
jgi:hypothetical protein